ncbi:MAG: arylesterase [Desulfuromonas sp.]|nr:MAG: arylesterase [Desulfuromonas sp.]
MRSIRQTPWSLSMRPSTVLLIILLLMTCLATLGCDSTPAIAKLHQQTVILAFGDSLTHGTGATREQSYPSVLADLLGNEVINAGVPGEISAEGLKRLPEALAEHQPDLVILCHGGNDFLRRMDQTQTADNLRRMIETIRGHGADVILLGVPQFGFVLEPPEFYGAIAEEFQVPYQSEVVSDLLSDRALKSDQIHPNSKGYQQMAEAVYELIRKAEQG